MSSSDLNFKNDNPGAVQHGNFINYYTFNPAENRIRLLPEKCDWINEKDIFCLDIGCNTGELTLALCEYMEKSIPGLDCRMLGIDIDPVLIERARENCVRPNIEFKCIDVMQQDLKVILSNAKRDSFNVVFCFSITMWIHLNNGDEGLHLFLEKLSKLGRIVVVEPQPFKCYKSAVKRLRKSGESFKLFSALKIRENVEEKICEIMLGLGCEKIHETPATEWGRRIFIFRRK